MAIVDGDPTGGNAVPTGIALRLTTSIGFQVRLERSTVSNTGPWTAVVLFPISDGAAQDFVDLLPMDNATRWYRAIAVRDGFDPSTASSVVSAVPQQLL